MFYYKDLRYCPVALAILAWYYGADFIISRFHQRRGFFLACNASGLTV